MIERVPRRRRKRDGEGRIQGMCGQAVRAGDGVFATAVVLRLGNRQRAARGKVLVRVRERSMLRADQAQQQQDASQHGQVFHDDRVEIQSP